MNSFRTCDQPHVHDSPKPGAFGNPCGKHRSRRKLTLSGTSASGFLGSVRRAPPSRALLQILPGLLDNEAGSRANGKDSSLEKNPGLGLLDLQRGGTHATTIAPATCSEAEADSVPGTDEPLSQNEMVPVRGRSIVTRNVVLLRDSCVCRLCRSPRVPMAWLQLENRFAASSGIDRNPTQASLASIAGRNNCPNVGRISH
ncbi:hypothetical protein LZ31DRAFT_300166 [Colletotrichum somersetense]|nr:hypothetical protein LZ31DRAFT_300166 [Colletotrichum somersetense]